MAAVKPTAGRWMTHWLCLVVVAISSCGESAVGFGASSSSIATGRSAPPFATAARRRCRQAQTLLSPPRRMSFVEITEDSKREGGDVPKKKVREDPNGTEFAKGAVVRVTSGSTRAYQVSAKGRGTFDPETKEFVPAPGGGEDRASRCLEVPVGLRGIVVKVIDANGLSASHPVQVKFTPGDNTDEGFDAPVPLLMHFGCSELEVVAE